MNCQSSMLKDNDTIVPCMHYSSGFTVLTEKFCNDNKNRKKGTDQLTSILNNYLTRIVNCMLSCIGIVLVCMYVHTYTYIIMYIYVMLL